MKKLQHIQRSDTPHWVGDGFPVRSIFTYRELGAEISPFLLMDYAGPADFSPTADKRGVGEHPHRGFETVTLVYSGEVEHRDSAGGGGKIGPGDVQWMTAASGLVHEEMHGREFARNGGKFEMIQLWVNLPAKDKKADPRYQGIRRQDIPVVDLAENAGRLRVVAGEFGGVSGPAKTFTPVNLWDISLTAAGKAELALPVGHTTMVFVRSGKVRLADGEWVGEAELALLDRESAGLSLHAPEGGAELLVLSGEPIAEPLVGYGPFVMNSWAEIKDAFADYENGKMGRMPEKAG